MSTRRPRRQNNNNHRHNQPQPSDYESDYQNYFSDTQQQEINMPPPPVRSNEELNLSVLRRHNPSITSILSLAPYAVIYIFSPTTRQWEKSGVEGSLFGSLGEERYNVFVLNRRGLHNFDVPLTEGDNVEITEEYVILKVDNDSGLGVDNNNGMNGKSADLRIYGLWIYSEPPPNSTAETRSINAQVIRECAIHAGQSLKLARERLEATRQNGLHAAAAAAASTADPVDEVQSSVAMGRQVSLRDLFGQQRAQDDGWSTTAHHVGPQGWPQPGMSGPMAQPQPQPQQDVLGDLFRRAGLAYQGGP
ncbi:hypothetical protein APSETT444_007196 [Aspergillus pseudonomiae]